MSSVITCVDDLQEVARKRVPRLFYDYVDSGSWSESTYRANGDALARLKFRQRVGCNVADISTDGRMLGERVAMPIGLAPAGRAGTLRPPRANPAAAAAAVAGAPYLLFTAGICSTRARARQ